MANQEHLAILKQGVHQWNKWREQHPDIVPDLTKAELIEAQLRGAHLGGTQLAWSILSGANLNRANLRTANLRATNLTEANLKEADLTGADLSAANLTWAILKGTRLGATMLWYTSFARVDLSETTGLSEVHHHGPSSIGIDTFFRSKGKIPESFLRGCGVPEIFIEYAASLVGMPFDFHSCFISYSTKNQDFAQRLHADLQAKGVRCWFAPEDLKIGDKFRVAIDETIRVYDKLLLVLSEHSVNSEWVEKEVETAMEREREQKRTMLFPIRLDDAVMEIKTGWPADIRRTRHIGDFREWKDPKAYGRALDRLLRDLKADDTPAKAT